MAASDLRAFLERENRAVLVRVAAARGSTPRDMDAWMAVAPDALFGTIGGGQLEFLAIGRARAILAGREAEGAWSQPLGPEIGQCCGGHVTLDFTLLDETGRERLLAQWNAARAGMPHVYLFGAGHVGTALAGALALLPVRTVVVETRADALEALSGAIGDTVETRLAAMPEAVVREAPSGSAFIVLTHDHALDFLIVSEALKRDDAAYAGLIGSATKRAVFRRQWLEAGGGEDAFAGLVCPIGGAHLRDKRPAVIAALTAAEVMTALAARGN
ncbi:MAG: xanthine dehydrogenase accessory protein XdhC [Phyllobacteriaceae bacterium]|nr:xanthine dehydrogenase accessory protein XdhC [Phyllobacteriaceae bacterium]MBA90975.1 xanthine dehydrogenase accessory protein XdhC [Phyllobacteriaceae bacterium]